MPRDWYHSQMKSGALRFQLSRSANCDIAAVVFHRGEIGGQWRIKPCGKRSRIDPTCPAPTRFHPRAIWKVDGTESAFREAMTFANSVIMPTAVWMFELAGSCRIVGRDYGSSAELKLALWSGIPGTANFL